MIRSLTLVVALLATTATAKTYHVPIDVFLAPGVTKQWIPDILREAETGLSQIGLKVKFDYTYRSYHFQGYSFENLRSDAAKFEREGPKGAMYRVVFFKKSRAGGHTRRWGSGPSVTLTNIDGGSHLFQHEMGHALGYNGHLSGYDAANWRFKGCGKTLDVKSYVHSGLQRSCKNRTFLGHYTTRNCPRGTPYSWNVPLYRDVFRTVFECGLSILASNTTPDTPPNKPKPRPTPKPEKPKKPKPPNYDKYKKYCPAWKSLIEKYDCR